MKLKTSTQGEIVRDNGVELVECIGTRCEHQDSLPQEQREMVGFLKADRDQVSPVEPCEVDRVYGANECTRSLGGMETPGFLVVTRIPDVIVPECVLKCVPEGKYGVSNMACVSACMEMDDGRIQTGDGNGEPGRPHISYFGNRAGSAGRCVRGPFRVLRTAQARTSARSQPGVETSRAWYETGMCTVKRKVV